MKIKIEILIFVVLLLISVTLLLFFNKQGKEDTIINDRQQENSIESNLENSSEKNNGNQDGEAMESQKIKLYINNHELTATLNDNSSTRALVEELKRGSITVNMVDYANMEKVGPLGVNLPRNDESITTSAGDLILYQGNSFVIYYDTNKWSLTRLGRIDNTNAQELKGILGNGDITVILSLN